MCETLQTTLVFGRSMWRSNNDIVFSLDRLCDFRISSHRFEYPMDFNPPKYFEGCIGVIVGADCKIEKVKLKVFSYHNMDKL